MLTRSLLLAVFLSFPCLANQEVDDGFADQCFGLYEGYLTNNYQYCERDEKKPKDGKHSCIVQNWSSIGDGKYKSKDFGWVTMRGGKRNGPAELLVSGYDEGDDADHRVKMHFKNDALDGLVKVTRRETHARCEIPFKNGKVVGIVRVLTSGGKLIAAREMDEGGDRSVYRAPFEIRFCKSGKISQLHCGKKSMVEEDAKPCGFGAKEPVETQLHSCWDGGRTITYWVKDGRIVKKLEPGYHAHRELDVTGEDDDDLGTDVEGEDAGEKMSKKVKSVMTTFEPPVYFGEEVEGAKVEVRYPSGKPMLRYQTKKYRPVDKLFYLSEKGKTLAEARFRGDEGEMTYYAEFFLNGQPKLVAETTGKTGETRVVETSAHTPDRVEECVYVDVPENAPYGYAYERRRLRIDLGKYGIRAAYVLEPRECRVRYQGEIVSTNKFVNGLPDGEQTDIDPENQTKIVQTYVKGKLVRVKVVRLGAGSDILEEYRVLEDGSREYLKRQARKGI